ncbi:hypothetical protein CR513_24579, partial [Mucuna pruriens]
MREFELQKIKESEIIKGYSYKLLSIANQIKLLGTNFAYSRIFEKILIARLKVLYEPIAKKLVQAKGKATRKPRQQTGKTLQIITTK